MTVDQRIAKNIETHRSSLEKYVNQLRSDKITSGTLCERLLENMKASMKKIDNLEKNIPIK